MSSTTNVAVLLVLVVVLLSMIQAKKPEELPDNARGNLCPKGANLLDSCDGGEGRCVQPGKNANSANGRLKCEPGTSTENTTPLQTTTMTVGSATLPSTKPPLPSTKPPLPSTKPPL